MLQSPNTECARVVNTVSLLTLALLTWPRLAWLAVWKQMLQVRKAGNVRAWEQSYSNSIVIKKDKAWCLTSGPLLYLW